MMNLSFGKVKNEDAKKSLLVLHQQTRYAFSDIWDFKILQFVVENQIKVRLGHEFV